MDARKIVSCLLALLMVFSLAACSQTAEEPQINVQTEEPAAAEPSPAEAPAEDVRDLSFSSADALASARMDNWYKPKEEA